MEAGSGALVEDESPSQPLIQHFAGGDEDATYTLFFSSLTRSASAFLAAFSIFSFLNAHQIDSALAVA
jgi:arabinogalactan endo-1,4-beta-galactosidase